MSDYKKEQFKEDYVKFYGLDEKQATKLDFNKLYQASRERGLTQPVNIPDEIKKHPDFKKNTKMFYGLQQSDTQSEWDRNANKFFAGNSEQVGNKFMNVQTNVEVNKESEIYKKNAAKFYGEDIELAS